MVWSRGLLWSFSMTGRALAEAKCLGMCLWNATGRIPQSDQRKPWPQGTPSRKLWAAVSPPPWEPCRGRRPAPTWSPFCQIQSDEFTHCWAAPSLSSGKPRKESRAVLAAASSPSLLVSAFSTTASLPPTAALGQCQDWENPLTLMPQQICVTCRNVSIC